MSLQPRPADPTIRPLTRADLRIGDAEREQVCRTLSDHFTAGRLSGDEFDERVGLAVQARTDGDLRRLLVDLPAPAEQAAAVAAPTRTVQAPSASEPRRDTSTFDAMFGLLAVAAGACLMLLFLASGERFALFGFFACLGAATVAAAITHLVHRSLARRAR